MEGRISVVNTYPSSNDTNVSTDTEIKVTFDKDISKRTLAGNVNVLSGDGEKIDCIISSANATITITPRNTLPPNNSITVIIKGNNDPENAIADKGICSPLGDYMLGNYIYSFSTKTAIKETERVVNMSPDNVAFKGQPIFKGDTTNDTINVARYIDIEVSTSNTFEVAANVWSGRCSLEEFNKGVSCDKSLPNGSYYWRARTVCDVNGEWCGCCSFAIDDHAKAVVVTDDHINIDVAFPKAWDMLDAKIESVYPEDNKSNVANNLKTITVVIDQIVPEEELQYASLSIVGETLDESDPSIEPHYVDANVSIVYDHDNNKTILVISLPVCEEEEEGES